MTNQTVVNPRATRLATALLVVGFVLLVGGLITVYAGNHSANIAQTSDEFSGYSQYGMYPGQIAAVLGIIAAIIGALSLIGYGITRYINR